MAKKKVVDAADPATKGSKKKSFGQRLGDVIVDQGKRFGKNAKDTVEWLGNPFWGGPKFAFNKVKNVGEGIFSFVKGLFNSPDWWRGESGFPDIAMNAQRPFSAKQLSEWFYDRLSSGAVGHVSHLNVGIEDPRKYEWFAIAMNQLFQSMREGLKSNLVYSVDDVSEYIVQSLSLALRIKSVERDFGWYRVTTNDLPELGKAVRQGPRTISETGLVNYVDPCYFKEDQLGDDLAKMKLLKAALSKIILPKHFIDFASWYAASVFADQSAPNPQIYAIALRRCPVYYYDQGKLQSKLIDPKQTDTIDGLRSEAINMASRYGVIMADLSKFTEMAAIEYVLPEEFNPTMCEDKEFFNMIINGYTEDVKTKASAYLLRPSAKGYPSIRFDIMNNLPKEAFIGSLASLGGLVDEGIVRLITQDFMYLCDTSNQYGDSRLIITKEIDGTTSTADTLATLATEFSGYNYSSDIKQECNFEFSVAATNSTVVATADSRWEESTVSPSGVSAILKGPKNILYTMSKDLRSDDLRYILMPVAVRYNATYNRYVGVFIHSTIPAGTGLRSIGACKLSVGYIPAQFWTGNIMALSAAEITNYNEFASATMTGATGVYYPSLLLNVDTVAIANVSDITLASSNATVITIINDAGTVNSDYAFSLNGDFFTLTKTISTPNGSVKAANDPAISIVATLIENWDYHIPFLIQETNTGTLIGSDNSETKLVIERRTNLLKECYIPVFITPSELKGTLEIMYYNLFSKLLVKKQRVFNSK